MSPASSTDFFHNEGIAGVAFDSAGHQLVGAMYLARGDRPAPTVLLLHGLPGLEQNGDLAVDLRDHGCNALTFHYRGCWGSGGEYDLGTVVEDVRAAVDYLATAPFPTVDPGRLAVAGHSMGGWAAIAAAAGDSRLAAMASFGAPARLGEFRRLGDDEIEREFTRFLAVGTEGLRRQLAGVASRPGPLELIGAIAPRPALIVHGGADEWVPAADGRDLHRQAGQPCRYVEIEGANHSFAWHRRELREVIIGWLTGVLSGAGESPTKQNT